MDQAKGKTAQTLIDINDYLEEAAGSNDVEEDDEKLPAIPVLDKLSGKVFPIQDISVPLKSISNRKINVLRVYTTEEHWNKVSRFCQKEFYEGYDEHLKRVQELKAMLDQVQKEEEERKKYKD